jgi:hypothetical protein
MNLKSFFVIALALTVFALSGCGKQQDAAQQAANTSGSDQQEEDVWAVGVYTGSSPFQLAPPAGVANPVISPGDVTDIEATIVAHPFMVVTDSLYYMYFTIKNPDIGPGHGGIGLASSVDGLNWDYRKIVVDQDYDLAYPYVFQWEDEYYMIPEPHGEPSVPLYRATSFPDQWVYEKDLLSGDIFISSTVFQHDGMWWMFAIRSGNETLRLFYAKQLKGQWTEHPQSPVVEKDLNTARPAGRPFIYEGELYRVGQDCAPTYGNKVHAFRITELSTTEYAEEMVQEPIFTRVSGSWIAQAAHHVDAHQLADGRWIAAVDGLGH